MTIYLILTGIVFSSFVVLFVVLVTTLVIYNRRKKQEDMINSLGVVRTMMPLSSSDDDEDADDEEEFSDVSESDLITSLLLYASKNDLKAKAIEIFLKENFYGLGEDSDPPNIPNKTFHPNYRSQKKHGFTLIQGGKKEEPFIPDIA